MKLTGKRPCRNCGCTERYSPSGDCVECAKKRSDQHHARRKASPGAAAYQARRNFTARLRTYGITENDVLRMMSRQMGLCAICRRRVATHIDHAHGTGAVRGILCFGCNAGLGSFCDSTENLTAAVEYLERNQGRVAPARVEPEPKQSRALTHCRRGHAFTDGNTYVQHRRGKTERVCRQCRRQHDRKRNARERAE